MSLRVKEKPENRLRFEHVEIKQWWDNQEDGW